MSTPLADRALAAPEQPPALAGAPPGGPPERAPVHGAFQAELARTAQAEGQQKSGGEPRAAARVEAGPAEAAVAHGRDGSEQRAGARRGKAAHAVRTGAGEGSAAAIAAEPQAPGAVAVPGDDALGALAAGAKLPSSEAAAGVELGEAPPAGSSTAAGKHAAGSAEPTHTVATDGTPPGDPSASDEAESAAGAPDAPSPDNATPADSAHTDASAQPAPLQASSPAGVPELPSQPSAGASPAALPTTAPAAPVPAPKPSPAPAPESVTPADRAGQAPSATPTGTLPDIHHVAKAPTGKGASALKLAAEEVTDPTAPGTAADIDAGSPAGLAQTPLGGPSAAGSTGEATPAYGVGLEQAIENMHVTIELAAREGLSQARIALEPEELGEIRIHLTQTSAGLIARVTAESPAAAQALAAGHAELRQSLSSMGLSLARLQIGHHGQASADAGRHDGAQDRQRTDGELSSAAGLTNGGSTSESPEDPQSDPTGELQSPQAPSPSTGALIDVLV